MSDFIVSARKYRPATFASVVGQKHITSTLRNAIERGQLAHAYLFCGPRGVGKTTCARIFAKAINCLSPNGAEACNDCESCRSFNEGRSLNIHELDAASNNSVEDIRTLIEQVRIIPQSGRYAVFIIDEVHMLSAAAFNAFLKTLEEPPAHAVFILATTEKHKIIPTILSRCQIYDFNRIRVEDSVEYLRYIAGEEHITADEESLNLIAQKADGGMRDALSMFDKAVSFCGTTLDYRNVARTLNVLDYDTYFSVTEMLVGGNYVDVLVTFDEVLSRGFSGQTFMAGLNRHMRDLLMAKRPETLRLIEMTGTLLERYRTQAGACDVGFLFGAISCLTELDGKIRQSSSQRLLVELGLMKIAGLGQKKNESPTLAGEYPLPDLAPRAAAAADAAATPASGNTAAAVSPRPATDGTQAPATAVPPQNRSTETASSQTENGGTAAAPAPAAAQAETPAEKVSEPTISAPAPATTATVPSVEAAAKGDDPAVPAMTQGRQQPIAGATPPATEPAPAAAQSGQQTAADTPAVTPEPATDSASVVSDAANPAVAAPSAASSAPTAPAAAQGTAKAAPATAAEEAAPAPAATATPAPPAARPAAARHDNPAPSTPRRSLISGASLTELLSAAGDPDEELSDGETDDEPEAPAVDPECAHKLERARSRILNLIKQKRPRFVAAFELMTFTGNTLAVSVPTPELRDEILRSKTGMLMRIAELAGVEGMIELEITVNEQIRAARPIKLEDRVRYITEKNPLVAELRKALDLEVE